MLIVHPAPLAWSSLEHWVRERAERSSPEMAGEHGRGVLRMIAGRRRFCAENPLDAGEVRPLSTIESLADAPELAGGLDVAYITGAVDRELQHQMWMWSHNRSGHYRSIVTELNALGCRLSDIVHETITGSEPEPRCHVHAPSGRAWFDEAIAGWTVTARVATERLRLGRQEPRLDAARRQTAIVSGAARAFGATSPRRARGLRRDARPYAGHAVESIREAGRVSPEPGIRAGVMVPVSWGWYQARSTEGFSSYVVPNLLGRRFGRHAVAHLVRLTFRTASLDEWRYRAVAAEAYVAALYAVMDGVRQATEESTLQNDGR